MLRVLLLLEALRTALAPDPGSGPGGGNPPNVLPSTSSSCIFMPCPSPTKMTQSFEECYRTSINDGDLGNPGLFPAVVKCKPVFPGRQLTCDVAPPGVSGSTCDVASNDECSLWCVEAARGALSKSALGCTSWSDLTGSPYMAKALMKGLQPLTASRIVSQVSDAHCPIAANCTLRCVSRIAGSGRSGACAAYNMSGTAFAGAVIKGLLPERVPGKSITTAGASLADFALRPSLVWGADVASTMSADVTPSASGLAFLIGNAPRTGGFPQREGLVVECDGLNSCRGLNIVCPRYSSCEVNCRNTVAHTGVCGTRDEPMVLFVYDYSPVSVQCTTAVPTSDSACFFVLFDAAKYANADMLGVAEFIRTFVARHRSEPKHSILKMASTNGRAYENRTCMWIADPGGESDSAKVRGNGVRGADNLWSCGDANDLCVASLSECPSSIRTVIERVVLTTALALSSTGQQNVAAALGVAAGGGTELTAIGQGFKSKEGDADPVVSLKFPDGRVFMIDDFSAVTTNTQVSVVVPNIYGPAAGGGATLSNATLVNGLVLQIKIPLKPALASPSPLSVFAHTIEAVTPGADHSTMGGHALYIVGRSFGDNRSVSRDGALSVFLEREIWDPVLETKSTQRFGCPVLAQYTDSLLVCTAPKGGGQNEIVIEINNTLNFREKSAPPIVYTYPHPEVNAVSIHTGCPNGSFALIDDASCTAVAQHSDDGAMTVSFDNGTSILRVDGLNFGDESLWSDWVSGSCSVNASAAGLCTSLQLVRDLPLGDRGETMLMCDALRFDSSILPTARIRCTLPKFVGAGWRLRIVASGLVGKANPSVEKSATIRAPQPILNAPIQLLYSLENANAALRESLAPPYATSSLAGGSGNPVGPSPVVAGAANTFRLHGIHLGYRKSDWSEESLISSVRIIAGNELNAPESKPLACVGEMNSLETAVIAVVCTMRFAALPSWAHDGPANELGRPSSWAWAWLAKELGPTYQTGLITKLASLKLSVDNQGTMLAVLPIILTPPPPPDNSAAEKAARLRKALSISLPLGALGFLAACIGCAGGGAALLIAMRSVFRRRKRKRGDVGPGEGIGWQRGERIGQGSFGTVYKGLNLKDGSMIAVKVQQLQHEGEGDSELESEIALMQVMMHDNIVRYLGTDRDASQFFIFLEYAPGGSLGSVLKSLEGNCVPSHDMLMTYTADILNGLAYMHEMTPNAVLHLDLKADNCLLDASGTIKLADFGTSKQIVRKQKPRSNSRSSEPESVEGAATTTFAMVGTPFFMAPEVVLQKEAVTAKADIWSLGGVIVQMATGFAPWQDRNFTSVQALLAEIARDDPHNSPLESIRLSHTIHPDVEHILSSCFRRDSEERPIARDLLRLRCFRELRATRLPKVLGSLRSALRGTPLSPRAAPVQFALRRGKALRSARRRSTYRAATTEVAPRGVALARTVRFAPSAKEASASALSSGGGSWSSSSALASASADGSSSSFPARRGGQKSANPFAKKTKDVNPFAAASMSMSVGSRQFGFQSFGSSSGAAAAAAAATKKRMLPTPKSKPKPNPFAKKTTQPNPFGGVMMSTIPGPARREVQNPVSAMGEGFVRAPRVVSTNQNPNGFVPLFESP